MKRWPLVALICLGLGLALAPVAFKMFERAPKGGRMIEGFEPYMSTEAIDSFRGHLETIGRADRDVEALEAPDIYPSLQRFDAGWEGIDADMGGMLNTMEANIGNYKGVAALPPFPLFPWFFVAPGLMIAAAGWWGLRTSNPRSRVVLAILSVGLIAAPGIFQMFSRAPGGADMIEDFKPFMTEAKVQKIQGYFLTIGSAEGDMRRDPRNIIPSVEAPGIDVFTSEWPRISADMAPMIGAMADNVDNFNAVKALPPFWLFPWFFVIPGVLGVALAVAARKEEPDTAPEVATA